MTRTTPELAPISKLPRHTNGRTFGQIMLLAHTPIRVDRHYVGFASEKKGKKPQKVDQQKSVLVQGTVELPVPQEKPEEVGACARVSMITCDAGITSS
ncbi:hypothetical protein AVEN_163278-1 [Araneus ventricosus]|uniref:Uncharacterized protein n=1 Tax=Araneus ventricosus TaxID=182803 RepID=A0A4Y2V497_ARAVE|nr:hypothetical protein AVEN_163278-1 [Araneus ventricosus]